MKKILTIAMLILTINFASFAAIEMNRDQDGTLTVSSVQRNYNSPNETFFCFEKVIKRREINYQLRVSVPGRRNVPLHKQCKLILDRQVVFISHQQIPGLSEEVDKLRRQSGEMTYVITPDVVRLIRSAKSVRVILMFEDSEPLLHIVRENDLKDMKRRVFN
jgi:hypothetical protein